MRQRVNVKWIGGTILVVLCGCFLFIFLLSTFLSPSSIMNQIFGNPPSDKTPEEIFVLSVFGGPISPPKKQSIPFEVTKIEAVEGWPLFGYMNVPAFIRFESSDAFVVELIEKDLYSPISCEWDVIDDNLIWEIHSEVGNYKTPEWWKPSEVASPSCYRSTNCTLYEDDEKYLLVDSNSNVRYFFRRAVCGLCPGGSRESIECKQIQFE